MGYFIMLVVWVLAAFFLPFDYDPAVWLKRLAERKAGTKEGSAS